MFHKAPYIDTTAVKVIPLKINLQKDKDKAKPYQVKQVQTSSISVTVVSGNVLFVRAETQKVE